MIKRLLAVTFLFIFTLSNINIYAEDSRKITAIAITDESFDMEEFKAANLCEVRNVFSEIMSGFTLETYTYNIEKIKAFKGISDLCENTYFKVPEVEPEENGISLFGGASGYLGEGDLVAVIDSSFNVSHEVFTLTDETAVKYTKEDISEILSGNSLNAEQSLSSLTSDSVYKSAKIPFAFDYAGKDINVKSSIYHGNAVASIVAGNSDTLKGVLPEAQLLLMKVATDSGSIGAAEILSAFEDAVILGADAINLSIGSAAGFSSGFLEGIEFEEVFKTIRDKGIFVANACGNEGYLTGEGLSDFNYPGTYPLTSSPDYSIVASPSTAFSAVSVAAANPATGLPASYSSIGPDNNLLLKPDIMAKGTYYAATVSGYDIGKGTSFASPEICAKSVVVSKALEDKGVEKKKLSHLTENILMSTTDVLTYDNDVAISPRSQGSGYVNIDRALSSKAVLYGNDGKSKLSLYDGLSKNFSFTFNVENLTGDELSYVPALSLVTDGYRGNRLSGMSVEVPHTTVFEPALISLGAYETKEITVNVTVDSSWADKNSSVFTNGFYLEGFVFLKSSDEILNIPFMGFYGDWYNPPVFIPAKYENGFGFAERLTTDKTNPKKLFYLGNNYFKTGNVALNVSDYEKIAFSPNGDGIFDTAKLYAGLYRDAKLLYWEIRNTKGEEQYSSGSWYVPKYSGMQILGNKYFVWNGTDNDGNKLSDGQYVLYSAAILDYTDTVIADEITYPIFLDTTPPEMSGYMIDEENGKTYLSFTATDNHYVQVGAVSDTLGNVLITDTDTDDGSYLFDITAYPDELLVETADFGMNFSGDVIKTGDEYIAYFNGDGLISRVNKQKGFLLNSEPSADYSKLNFNDGEKYAKVFLWTEEMKPIYNTVVYNK